MMFEMMREAVTIYDSMGRNVGLDSAHRVRVGLLDLCFPRHRFSSYALVLERCLSKKHFTFRPCSEFSLIFLHSPVADHASLSAP